MQPKHLKTMRQEEDNLGVRVRMDVGGVLVRLRHASVAAFVIFCCLTLTSTQGDPPGRSATTSLDKDATAPAGMVWIPGGQFTMGTGDFRSFPNERPAHKVLLEGFWIDEHDVTNAEFAKFVEATGYVTTAERKPAWEELKRNFHRELQNPMTACSSPVH